MAATTEEASLEACRAALQQGIAQYARRGYRVMNQTDTTAQLVKPKGFGTGWFVLWLCTGIVWPFYLFYHLAVKRERGVYLQVDASGVVHHS